MQLIDVRTPAQLARALFYDLHGLKALIEIQGYRHFTIPKQDGSKRTIEAPHKPLKTVLSTLASQLQDAYYSLRPSCSHGFIKTGNRGASYHIVSNASAHLGCRYLVNIDLDDFFHQVDEAKVHRIFAMDCFRFNRETEELLTKLVCYHRRLPMGSPASPVLSNFAMLQADAELMGYASAYHITYTRYVDDLSFSSTKPLPLNFMPDIKSILQSHRFVADPQKEKWFGKEDTKWVTGLILTNSGIQLPLTFFEDLEDTLATARMMIEKCLWLPPEMIGPIKNALHQTLAGRLSMVKQVYGQGDGVYNKLDTQIQQIFRDWKLPAKGAKWPFYGYQW